MHQLKTMETASWALLILFILCGYLFLMWVALKVKERRQ
jgi:hypothetical protein